MKLSDIIFKEECIVYDIDEDLEFNIIISDPENVQRDNLLIIPNSKKYNDNIVLHEKPVAVICDANCVISDEIPVIRVENPRLAMANAYFRYEKICFDNMKIIGITGTNGKSTTAMLIKKILSECGHNVGLIGTGKIEINNTVISDSNYSMTTPDPNILYKTLKRMQNEGCDAVVMEISSHALALNKVDPILFDYALFTNFSSDHIDFHGTIDEYFSAKLRLFDRCRCAVFNIDDEKVRRAYNDCNTRRISAGIIWRGDIWASNIENHGFDGVDYIYHSDTFSFKSRLQLAGIYNVYNSMLAATVCIDIGCKPCEVKEFLSQTSSIPGRFEIIKDSISVIIDYAHTDSAFDNIMKELYLAKKDKKLTVVFGCGGERDRTKRPKMAAIAEKYANKIILTADNSRNENLQDIISDIIRGFKKGKYEVIENRRDAIRASVLCADKGDVIALIGKGPEKYNIDSNGYSYFDEKEIVKSALEERRAIR